MEVQHYAYSNVSLQCNHGISEWQKLGEMPKMPCAMDKR